jgi:hypothetical protein
MCVRSGVMTGAERALGLAIVAWMTDNDTGNGSQWRRDMAQSEDAQTKQWVDTWRRAGSALDEVKRRELRSYDYEANREVIDEMLDWACDHATPRTTSGLVEQQRVFMKIREALAGEREQA